MLQEAPPDRSKTDQSAMQCYAILRDAMSRLAMLILPPSSLILPAGCPSPSSCVLLRRPRRRRRPSSHSSALLGTFRHSSALMGTPPHSSALFGTARHSSALLGTVRQSSALFLHRVLLMIHPPSYLTAQRTSPGARVAKTPFLGVCNNTHTLPTLPRTLRYPTTQCTSPGGARQKLPFWESVMIHTPFLPYHAANVPRGARGKNSLSGG